ncbi:Conserved_hypothetical protein [Hexamita inflata]|uniref:Uncharacterized protein n=1 Tax=Hexamita inflata TaxID=28002 RepID=A0AA86TSZ4_9EUKA|nr:Conserved hypothetical protein [Hexamita inflata]CAI9925632.1 Conserved hypothetical protein [Hexamita inflata]
MSFEAQVELDSRKLKQEIKNLRSQLNNVTQKVSKVHTARQMQYSEVSSIAVGEGMNITYSLPLQSQVTTNDDLQLIIAQMNQELQVRLKENNELRNSYQSLAQRLTDIKNKNVSDKDNTKQLFLERSEHDSNYERLRNDINEYHQKTVQMSEMHQATVRAGDQMRSAVFGQIASCAAEKNALENQHFGLQHRYEELIRCDVSQAAKTVQEAAKTIEVLTNKVELLQQQILQSRDNTARVQDALSASMVAQHIDDQSLRKLTESPQRSVVVIEPTQGLNSSLMGCASAYTPQTEIKRSRIAK